QPRGPAGGGGDPLTLAGGPAGGDGGGVPPARRRRPRGFSLVDALDSPRLFAPPFPSPAWDAWRAFARALVGAPMSPEQLAVFRACTGRQDAPAAPATECWVVSGRRSGKSRVASAVAAHIAALAPVDRLAPGETGVVLVCAVDRTQASVVMNYV